MRNIKFFNLEHAMLGALVMAVPVGIINSMAGWQAALLAALTQYILSFIIIGINTAIHENLYKIHSILGILGPTLFSTGVASVTHYVAQTPEFTKTILFVFLMALSNFTTLTVIHHKYKTIHPWTLLKEVLPPWQNWSNKIMYGVFWIPILLFLSIKHKIGIHENMYANPGLDYGGICLASKEKLHRKFEDVPQFLKQLYVPAGTSDKVITDWMKENKLEFPIFIKPDQGHIGIGVEKINTQSQLSKRAKHINYNVQEYCDYKDEYGIYYCRYPSSKKGKILGITKKELPVVTGDGTSTVKQLIEDKKFNVNRKSLLKYSTKLHLIPKKGEQVRVIDAGSHTMGTFFIDASDKITPELEHWIDHMSQQVKGLHIGRYDMKIKEDLNNPQHAKIVEFNGAQAEPIHMYDDKHTLRFAIKTFYKTFDRVFAIARICKPQAKKITIKKLLKDYKKFFANKKTIFGSF